MSEKLLEMKNISKKFPGVLALDEVDISLESGEIKGLVGENGAGKSTLIKILAGIYQPDQGSIRVEGRQEKIKNPARAKELGFSFIHQDLNLVPEFDAVENIWLGYDYPRKKGRFSRKEMETRVKKLAGKLDFDVDLSRPVSRLSASDRWLVSIIKAFMMEARLLVLDEPTAALTDAETEKLFNNLKKIREQGIAIIYISHRLEEIFRLADSAVVLRNGKKVHSGPVSKLSREKLIKLMTGRTGKESRTSPQKREMNRADGEILRVENLTGPGFSDINFTLRSGEILGFYGLIGAGRTALMEAIFGLKNLKKGSIHFKGEEITPDSPAEMIERGMVLIPEDRRNQGLIDTMDVRQNISLPSLSDISLFPPCNHISSRREKQLAEKIVDELDVKTASLQKNIKFLSGGNQQKVVIGKWLNQKNELYIFDEPTSGIDVGARQELYELMEGLAEKAGLIVISSELPEIIRLSHRVEVMNEGRITGTLTGSEVTRENILDLSYREVRE